jgi:hypothetical protein
MCNPVSLLMRVSWSGSQDCTWQCLDVGDIAANDKTNLNVVIPITSPVPCCRMLGCNQRCKRCQCTTCSQTSRCRHAVLWDIRSSSCLHTVCTCPPSSPPNRCCRCTWGRSHLQVRKAIHAKQSTNTKLFTNTSQGLHDTRCDKYTHALTGAGQCKDTFIPNVYTHVC